MADNKSRELNVRNSLQINIELEVAQKAIGECPGNR